MERGSERFLHYRSWSPESPCAPGGEQCLRCRCLRESWGSPARPATRRRPDSMKLAISFERRAIGCRLKSERAAKRNRSISSIITACGSRRATTGPDAPHANNFNMFAAELYAFTGAWGKYLSSNIKATIYPEKSYDTEDHLRVQGNIKATMGNEKRFFEVRAGVPHPMEGFGASDTTISDTRPYLQEQAANFNQTTFFTPWNFHQSGVTFGYYQGRTAVRALLLSSVRLHNDKDALEPFGRREPFTDSLPLSKHSGVDFQLLVNRILNFNGGAVTFYYYHGNMNIPILNPDGTFQPDRAFRNDFDRVAFYASYPVAKRLTLLGGVQRGRDD